MAIIGVAGQRAHAHHEARVDRRSDADLGAKFVTDPGLALRDAIDVGFMQGIDFAAASGGLMQQARDQHQRVEDCFP